MFASSTRQSLRRGMTLAHRRLHSVHSSRATLNTVLNNGSNSTGGTCNSSSASPALYAGVFFATAAVALNIMEPKSATQMEAIPSSGDVIMLGATKEKATGILFPKQCNGFMLAGTGVRVKYGFVKVYAVGTYLDPLAMSVMKGQSKEDIQKALLNPMYPRTIRIVMARGLSIEKFTDALNESLKPRMNGEDLQTLDEFKKLNPAADLVQGAEMELTIRGDTLLYKNALGGVGIIRSAAFCKALCDVYYGDKAVSTGHRDSVLEGVPKL